MKCLDCSWMQCYYIFYSLMLNFTTIFCFRTSCRASIANWFLLLFSKSVIFLSMIVIANALPFLAATCPLQMSCPLIRAVLKLVQVYCINCYSSKAVCFVSEQLPIPQKQQFNHQCRRSIKKDNYLFHLLILLLWCLLPLLECYFCPLLVILIFLCLFW